MNGGRPGGLAICEGGRSSESNGVVGARGLRPRGWPIEQEVPTVNDGMSPVARNAAGVMAPRLAGAIVAGFDVHLRQITFDCLDAATGEVTRGRIGSSRSGAGVGRAVLGPGGACRDGGVHWLAARRSRVGGCRRDRHLAETVETRALRGRKRRAKTDRQDALWLRELLAEGRLPEA